MSKHVRHERPAARPRRPRSAAPPRVSPTRLDAPRFVWRDADHRGWYVAPGDEEGGELGPRLVHVPPWPAMRCGDVVTIAVEALARPRGGHEPTGRATRTEWRLARIVAVSEVGAGVMLTVPRAAFATPGLVSARMTYTVRCGRRTRLCLRSRPARIKPGDGARIDIR